ncbi:MAG: sigma factor-like helix-turn-helix DNA-binding protein [Clostridium perfringens]|nr:sigma factor-like helix-turn-helix DNA-binding protein [Clostridium perfringens]
MKIIYNKENVYKEALKAPLSKKEDNNSLESKIAEDNFLIEDIFSDDKFYNFRRFCRNNKYKLLEDLNKNVLKEFESIKGVGRGKIETIILRLEEIYSDKQYIKDKFYYFKSIDFSNENQEIVHVFWQDKYNRFKDFCKKNGVKYIGEIDNLLLQDFKNTKGVGEAKIENIVKILKSHAVEDKKNDFFDTGKLYDFVKDLSLVRVCRIFKVECDVSDILIKDIEGKKIKDISCLKTENLEKLLKELNSLKSPKDILEDFKNSSSDRTKSILLLRYYENRTLQDIANNYGLTRERVRQIISIAINNLNSLMITENFISSIKIYGEAENYIDYNKFKKLLGEDNTYIINILVKEEIIIKFYKELGRIYFK